MATFNNMNGKGLLPSHGDWSLTFSPDSVEDYFDFSAEIVDNNSNTDFTSRPIMTSYNAFDAEFAGAEVLADAAIDLSNHVGQPTTVSPEDMFLETPPSSTLTDLTTPGTRLFESPYGMISSTNTSPMFQDELLGDESNVWPSLFPGEHDLPQSSLHKSHSYDSVDDILQTVEVAATPMSRHASNASPRTHNHTRHSSIAGVSARRRDKPLPPIKVANPDDVVEVKRARNTEAARKSREKKMLRMEALESENAELKSEVQRLKSMLGM
jgi:general control protein GCN4